MELRPYQQLAVDDAVTWARTAQRGDYRMYASPCGTGKSFVETAIQEQLGSKAWLITPRLEIAKGLLDKRGHNPQSLAELVHLCEQNRIMTPIRMRNRLFGGQIDEIEHLIFDECHHASAESWREVWLAAGMPPIMLFSATCFRATPRATKAFRDHWGDPIQIITIREAAARGDISMPEFEILPLVDDDIIELNAAGEFDVTALDSATNDRLSDMANIAVDRWYSPDNGWGRFTVFCLPSVATAKRMVTELDRLGASAAAITAKTPDIERRVIVTACRLCKMALVQVSVLGEGVDLPVRRLIDLAPAISPVKWLQQFGRATRPVAPGEAPPEVIITNRNLSRHSYLLENLVPATKVAEATAAFGEISKRAGQRAVGLEHLGRFKATNLRLIDGNVVTFYTLSDAKNGRLTDYACLVHPLLEDVLWAHRVHSSENGERRWGHWVQCVAPTELKGFVSQTAAPPSPKQAGWWERSAEGFGISLDNKLDRRTFGILPFCVDLHLRLAKQS